MRPKTSPVSKSLNKKNMLFKYSVCHFLVTGPYILIHIITETIEYVDKIEKYFKS